MRQRGLLLATIGCLALVHGDSAGSAESPAHGGPKVIAYVTGWSRPVAIDTARITHVNFAFAKIDDTGRVVLPAGESARRLDEIVATRRAHPALRVLVSIGGWSADGFSDAALSAESRERFADSALELLERHALDGIDLDWEYPGQDVAGIKARPEDRENFTLLLAAVRARLDRQSRDDHRPAGDHYLLTIATADREYFDHVEMSRLHGHVDWINVMAYDFYNSLTPTTGHHAGLHRAATAAARDRYAESSIDQHLAAGVPAAKLVLGVAFYGRRFEGVTDRHCGLNQAYAKYGGDHSYSALVEDYIGRNGYVRHWDPEALAPWLWNPATRSFITYDDPQSIRLKAAFAQKRQLGGIMFWELSQDDDGALLRAIAEGLGLAGPPRDPVHQPSSNPGVQSGAPVNAAESDDACATPFKSRPGHGDEDDETATAMDIAPRGIDRDRGAARGVRGASAH